MYSFEHIAEKLDVALESQLQASVMLETPVLTADHAEDLLILVRELSRVSELLTVKLVRELKEMHGFDPNSRTSFNKLLHKGKFTRKELKNVAALADDLFDQPASVANAEPIPARMPATRQGFESAAFGADSAREIANVLDQIPEGTPAESVGRVEQMLAQLAATLAPDDLRKAGIKILQGLNAESEPTDKDRQRRRSVGISAQNADLMAKLNGDVTPELKALLDRLFADYAGPGDLLPDGDKDKDARTAGQRRHDALVAALSAALHREGPMPPTRGCSTVVATMTLEQLQQAAGVVATDVGTLLPVKDLIRLGADRNAFLAILDPDTGNLIELGRTKRAADVYHYLGLVASQGGDMTPGSDLPAAMCEIHHNIAWRFGGLTTGDNTLLVGHKVHRNIDDTHTNPKKYWTICTSTGHLVWKLPEDLDPERRPVMNFNPATWFNPGQMLRLGMHAPTGPPPFQIVSCPHCGKQAA